MLIVLHPRGNNDDILYFNGTFKSFPIQSRTSPHPAAMQATYNYFEGAIIIRWAVGYTNMHQAILYWCAVMQTQWSIVHLNWRTPTSLISHLSHKLCQQRSWCLFPKPQDPKLNYIKSKNSCFTFWKKTIQGWHKNHTITHWWGILFNSGKHLFWGGSRWFTTS